MWAGEILGSPDSYLPIEVALALDWAFFTMCSPRFWCRFKPWVMSAKGKNGGPKVRMGQGATPAPPPPVP